jgi:DNA-binding Lrp family transcriptional regulator
MRDHTPTTGPELPGATAGAVMTGSDALIVRELMDHPRSTAIGIAESTGLSRSTVHARLGKLEAEVLHGYSRRIPTESLGLPLSAYVFAQVTQSKLGSLASSLARLDEIIQVDGISGEWDLIIAVAARDADDLYRVADLILATDGIVRTSTALVMRPLVPYRVTSLVERVIGRFRAR